jgi:single-strand DNA-binding protein
MARSVNKVTLIGHLGKDPELKYTPNNVPVATFSVATTERFKDRDGNWQDRTEWHNIVAWQRTAEIAHEYLKKGRQVYIEGRLQTRSWDDKNTGEKKYRTEVVVTDMVLLGGARETEGAPSRSRPAAAGANNIDQRGPDYDSAPGTQITDDDIPF